MIAAKHRAPGPYCDGKPGNGCPRFGYGPNTPILSRFGVRDSDTSNGTFGGWVRPSPPGATANLSPVASLHSGCRFLLHYRPKHRAYPCPDDE